MDVLQSLWQIVVDLEHLAVGLLALSLRWSLLIAWVSWWLWGVNWRKTWKVLGQGAWAPLVLLMVVAALVWSRIAPSACSCLGFITVPNFWWQLGGIGLLAALTLFCGYLQGLFGWTPAEIDLAPPVAAHGHHGHTGHYH